MKPLVHDGKNQDTDTHNHKALYTYTHKASTQIDAHPWDELLYTHNAKIYTHQ